MRETLAKGRAEYEALIRKTRWGDGPIYVVGSGPSYLAGLTATYAFEGLLGWPVVARSASIFETYTLPVLRPRSVVLAVSHSTQSEGTVEAARAARSRGAVVLALTANPAGPLAQVADGVFLLRVGGESEAGVKTMVSQQAAANFISLVAARVLKRHHPGLDDLEEEFEKLPSHVEWVFTQLADAVRSLACELRGSRRLGVVGAGFYHPAALLGALLMRRLAGIQVEGYEVSEFQHSILPSLDPQALVGFLSGSRCRLKKDVHQVAARVKQAGRKIVSVTDSNDRELADRSTLALLLPTLTEMVGSTLTLVLLAWVVSLVARERGQDRDRLAPKPSGKKEGDGGG